MNEKFSKYLAKKRLAASDLVRNARKNKVCYAFLLPYAVLFITFYVLPMVTSIYFSFTNYNILEKPDFIGARNYLNLFLEDEVFTIAIKNTFLVAIITGPVGYIMAFIFAWLINELPKWVRTLVVFFFYAPSISGTAFVVFKQLFNDDANGWINRFLITHGFTNTPILFLTNPQNVMKVIVPVILWTSLGTGFLSFVAGLKGIDKAQYEAGYIDGIQNRWQELWFITLPNMKPMLLFGAVMSITTAFNVCDIPMQLAGYPSTDYCARTIVTHLFDYGFTRFEMGYASAIATVLFITMILCNKAIQALLNRVGH
ncbi:multiple sugar transport system permease protein [Treponema bryantii]|uniref:Multiple sugar transport system permease protein n=1 Tax=Treponema bryantii TaxID=163 RepID=A0A1I3MBL2_9SPIR|nr:sugar ABC transporter permease [Treponema bryantii]SFI94373.1 multiple sugar transport system permease protein [Treponema bryantii]